MPTTTSLRPPRRSRTLAPALVALLVAAAAPAVAADRDVEMCDGHEATIVGTDDRDVLVGTEGPDVIVGLDRADRIEGLGGDDIICAGRWPDVVDGGPGDDRIFGGSGYDVLVGGPGDDLIEGGVGEDKLFGGDGADVLRGDEEGDELSGGPGDDRLLGGSDDFGDSDLVTFDEAEAGVVVDLRAGTSDGATEGRDRLSGIEGARGSPHPDRLLGGRLADLLIAAGEGDELRGRGGDDTLRAGAGSVYGNKGRDLAEVSGSVVARLGKGADTLMAGAGQVEADLGPGDDRALVHTGSHVVLGGEGADTLRLWWMDFLEEDETFDPMFLGGPGKDRVRWAAPTSVIVDVKAGELSSVSGTARFDSVHSFLLGPGDDRVYGGPGPQLMHGGAGDDLLKGLAGDDILRGGRGDDQAFGGPGRDRCTAEFEHGCERR